MARTYAFAIGGALLLALTLVPVLCSYFLGDRRHEPETFVDRFMKRRYLRALEQVLNHRGLTLAVLGGLLAFTFALIPTLGGEFMPELEEGNLWIRAVLPRTVSFEAAARAAPRLREVIATVPEVQGVMSHVGRPDDGTDVTSFFNVEFNVPLKPMEQWRRVPNHVALGPWRLAFGTRCITRAEIENELMSKFREFQAVDFNFSQLIRDNVEEALSGVKGANSVKIFGTNLDALEMLGQRVAGVLKTVPGIANVGVFHLVGQPNLVIRIDREACARYGINVADVEAVAEVAIGGRAFTQMVEGEKLYDIVLRLPEHLRSDPTTIARIPVDVPGVGGRLGYRIPLAQLATIIPHQPGASYIYRENNRRFVPVKFSVTGRDLASAIAEAQRRVAETDAGIRLPAGYRMEWSGEFAQMQRANARLLWIVPVSIGLIVILLYTAFRSFKDSLLVMANVVAATMGVETDWHALLDLGRGGLHFNLRRLRAGRCAADLIL